MIHQLLALSRIKKQLVILLVDSVIIVLILLASFSIRLGYWYVPESDLIWVILGAPIVAIPVFGRFGLYRAMIRYIGFRALWAVFQAVTLYALLWGIIGFMAAVEGIPRSVILINWLLAVIAIGGSRLVGRWILTEIVTNEKCSNVVIYGAGSAGRQLSIALTQSTEYNPVAFIDDNSALHRQYINGIKVVSRNDLERLIKQQNVTEVLLAIPTLSRLRRNEIINALGSYSVVVRSLPSLTDLAQGRIKVNDLLEINLRDLLGREPVKPNTDLLKINISNKEVLVTGAGGSIGSELCRQILLLGPKKLVLYEISESSLYTIEQELLNMHVKGVKIFPVIGSVSDKGLMKFICNYYDVKTIYHAAAYKHVPLVEFNPTQGILNNTIGTLNAAKAAISSNVKTFVLISTDKAVRPTNIMGASKRVAELALQALDKEQKGTCFTMVRFGNVLDSSGSVIPLFKNQIKVGGPVTVTHPDVVRYFMTIPEAVELVIQSGAMANGGEVFVLDMGEPIRIHDLAVKMIKLSGLSVKDKSNINGDIEIEYTGLRPGEKLYEELLVDGRFTITENELIMRAEEEMICWDKLESVLTEIENISKNIESNDDIKKINKLLTQLVPQFNLQSKQ